MSGTSTGGGTGLGRSAEPECPAAHRSVLDNMMLQFGISLLPDWRVMQTCMEQWREQASGPGAASRWGGRKIELGGDG